MMARLFITDFLDKWQQRVGLVGRVPSGTTHAFNAHFEFPACNDGSFKGSTLHFPLLEAWDAAFLY